MRAKNNDTVKFLESETPIKIRFGETDAMGVVWHGNYLKYFEDAREAFGIKFGLTYLDVYSNGYFIPIVKTELEHKTPLLYGESAFVRARQLYTPAAKIIFQYEIFNAETSKLCTSGTTIQIFMNSASRELELTKPKFYKDWEREVGW